MEHLAHYMEAQLQARTADDRLRRLRTVLPASGAHVTVDGRPLVNFASNDYLGLSSHPELKERAIEYTRRFGTGSGASRLLSGNIEPYDHIERKLASLKGTETAIILPTGFQANLTVLPAVAGINALIACDRLAHNSLLQGAQLAARRWTRFDHGDLNHLDECLSGKGRVTQFTHKWIVTESVFSMDGDRADLPGLQKIASAHNAALYLDEAHATGVLGEFGMGMSAGKAGIDVAMGTFGKACGSFGAYIACSNTMKEYLVNFCAGLIYSTALPPAVLGAIDAALDVIPRMEKQRQLLLENADKLRTQLHKMGFATANSTTQIIPVMVDSDESAVKLAQYLQDGGIFAPAIRPPTVPDGCARVRLSLTVEHTYEHLNRLVQLLRNWHAH